MLFEITIRIPLEIVQEVIDPLLYFWRQLIYSQNHWLLYIYENNTAVITISQHLSIWIYFQIGLLQNINLI